MIFRILLMTFRILIYEGWEQHDLQDDLAWVSGGPVLSHGPRPSWPRVLTNCCQKLFHIQLVITVVFFSVFFELCHGTQMEIQVETSLGHSTTSLWFSSQCSLNRNRPDEEVPDVTDQYGTVLGYNEPNQVELLFTNNKPKHIVSTTK